MPDVTKLRELLARCEKAEGPDRALDHAIGATLDPKKWALWPNYASSIDASIALVEKALPGAEYEITNLYGVASATLPLNSSDYPYETGRNECGSMPLAILAALLKALLSQQEEEGTR